MRKRRKYQIPGQMTMEEWFADMGQCTPKKTKYKAAPRRSWNDYGIDEKRKKELFAMARSKEYAVLAHSAAHTAVPELEGYILLSVTKNLSYEGLQTLWELKKIDRMPCCRTDFYAWRRYFYHIVDLKLKEMGK